MPDCCSTLPNVFDRSLCVIVQGPSQPEGPCGLSSHRGIQQGQRGSPDRGRGAWWPLLTAVVKGASAHHQQNVFKKYNFMWKVCDTVVSKTQPSAVFFLLLFLYYVYTLDEKKVGGVSTSTRTQQEISLTMKLQIPTTLLSMTLLGLHNKRLVNWNMHYHEFFLFEEVFWGWPFSSSVIWHISYTYISIFLLIRSRLYPTVFLPPVYFFIKKAIHI